MSAIDSNRSSASSQSPEENSSSKENAENKKLNQNVSFDWLPEEGKTIVVDFRGKFVKDFDPQTDQSLPAYPRNTLSKSQF